MVADAENILKIIVQEILMLELTSEILMLELTSRKYSDVG